VLARTQTKEEYGNLTLFLFGIPLLAGLHNAAILDRSPCTARVDIADACLLIYG